MCPFILPTTDCDASISTNFLVLTTACFYNNFVQDVIAYSKKLTQIKQSVLLFDGSLGLGDLYFMSKTHNKEVDAVLAGQKAISILIKKYECIDLISGESKKMNLGACSDAQLQNILLDLKLLGKNYQNVLVYVPPTLPCVQKFFCSYLKSLCFTQSVENSIASTKKLMAIFPNMTCYLNAKEGDWDIARALLLSGMVEKDKILYNFTD